MEITLTTIKIKKNGIEQRYQEYLETFQGLIHLENEAINKQDFLVLNEYLKKSNNIKELKYSFFFLLVSFYYFFFVVPVLTNFKPSNILEILKSLVWKHEKGHPSNIQCIEYFFFFF